MSVRRDAGELDALEERPRGEGSVVDLVALLEALHPACGVDHASLSGVIGVTLAADFYSKILDG
jgi:hypothetical protein